MILPGDDMSLASLVEEEGRTQTGSEQSQMLVDVSHARRPARASLHPPAADTKRAEQIEETPEGLQTVIEYLGAHVIFMMVGIGSTSTPRQDDADSAHPSQRAAERQASRSYYPAPRCPPHLSDAGARLQMPETPVLAVG